MKDIRKRVGAGTSLADAMRHYPELYPINFINLVRTGEKSGTLDSAFTYLAEFYTKEVKNSAKRIPTVIEPILLVVIAVMICFIALSIITPIYTLTSGFNR